jgi:hypothetical protein
VSGGVLAPKPAALFATLFNGVRKARRTFYNVVINTETLFSRYIDNCQTGNVVVLDRQRSRRNEHVHPAGSPVTVPWLCATLVQARPGPPFRDEQVDMMYIP